jgi:hypothetical protein
MTPWASDQLVARHLYLHTNTEKLTHKQTLNIHALSGIRTHDPGFRANEDSACLRALGYRDRRLLILHYLKYLEKNLTLFVSFSSISVTSVENLKRNFIFCYVGFFLLTSSASLHILFQCYMLLNETSRSPFNAISQNNTNK